MPKSENLKGVSVVFFDGYHPTGDMGWMEQETICPLNTRFSKISQTLAKIVNLSKILQPFSCQIS